MGSLSCCCWEELGILSSTGIFHYLVCHDGPLAGMPTILYRRHQSTNHLLKVTVMALNVYLTIRRKRSLKELKKSDLLGMGLAFVVPFPSALTFLLWRPNGRTVYGDATTWCWISRESGILRLVAFYIPIWYTSLPRSFLICLTNPKQDFHSYIAITFCSEWEEHTPSSTEAECCQREEPTTSAFKWRTELCGRLSCEWSA